MTQSKIFSPLIIIIIGLTFFVPFLGAVHLFDWDEINFAESAREMLVTGNYTRVQIDYQPFWEKPPLFFWLQAMSMKAFGVNEFAARFPNAITGILTLLTFYFIGKKIYDERFGFIWACCMVGSFLPHLYFKSGIIDPLFNYFIFMGIYCAILLIGRKGEAGISRFAALSGLFIGLGTLTKGPVALLIAMLTIGVYWITVRFKPIISVKNLMLFSICLAATAGVWFALDLRENGFGFFMQFINYQVQLLTQPVAGHEEPIYYHFLVVFVGCFPISVFALPALIKNYREKSPLSMKQWMLILFWVVMILFTIVKTKIVHYSSLSYFPLAFLASTVIYNAIQQKKNLAKWLVVLLLIMGSIFSLLLFAAPWLAQHKELLIPYIKDPFAVDCLNSDVSWYGYEQYIGLGYFLLLLIAIVLIWKNRSQQGVFTLFTATAVCLLIYLKAVVPKIEDYSQGPAIKFYESLQGQHVYVSTVGFKSYAPFFYFRKMPGDNTETSNEEWLLQNKLDRPAYFVVKTTSMKRMQQYADIQFLRQEGGFAFYEKKSNE